MRLLYLSNFPEATFIQGATSIPDSRVRNLIKLPCSESPLRCIIEAAQLEIRIHDATPKTTIS